MTELIAAVLGAIVGAGLGYGLGWWKDARTAARERKAVATALLVEIRDVRQFIEQVISARDLPKGNDTDLPIARIDTPMLREFYQSAHRFEARSVAALTDFYRAVSELQVLVASMKTRMPFGETARVSGKTLSRSWEAGHVADVLDTARSALLAEGGTEIPFQFSRVPNGETDSLALASPPQ